jgi:hypothetical protein
LTSGTGDFAVTGVFSAASVVVTSPNNSTSTNLAEFMSNDQGQGIAVGTADIRSVGTKPSIDLNLTPKGTDSSVVVNGDLRVTGAVDVPAGSIAGPMLRADPIGCVTVERAVAGAGVQVATVFLRDFGFGTSHTRTGGGCRCQSDTGNQVMVFNNPEGDDAWRCICKDTLGNERSVTTAFVIGCRLR